MSEKHDYDGITYREEKGAPGIFRILFTVLVLWGVAFMGYFLFSGWSSQSEADAVMKEKSAKKQAAHQTAEGSVDSREHGSGHKVESYIASGKQHYGKLCASCHGENAKGTVGPDLTASAYKYGKTRTEIAKSITEGRPNGMPGFGSQIDHEQVEALVEYLLSLK